MTEGQNKEDGKLREGETPKPNKMKENMYMETTYIDDPPQQVRQNRW